MIQVGPPSIVIPPESLEWPHQRLAYVANAVAPHVETMRIDLGGLGTATHKLQHACLYIRRVTAAAPVGRAYIELREAGTGYVYLHLDLITNGVNDNALWQGALDVYLTAQSDMRLYTFDGSTGGTIDYRAILNFAAPPVYT